MFRRTKKRPPSGSLRSVGAEEEEEDGADGAEDTNPGPVTAVLRAKVKRTVVRVGPAAVAVAAPRPASTGSFASLGYGGSAGGDSMSLDDDEEAALRAEAAAAATPARYDSAAIRLLQAQQAAPPAPDGATDPDRGGEDDLLAADFVPLNADGADDDAVLNGEDALLLEARLQEMDTSANGFDGLGLVADDAVAPADPWAKRPDPWLEGAETGAGAAWEDQVVRRAGVATSAGRVGRGADSGSAAVSGSGGPAMLQQLCDRVDATLQQLGQQQEDLRRARDRREASLELSRQTLERQQSDVQRSGRAVEFYQRLRLRLASWVGGLRQLQRDVRPIQEALHVLDAEMACIQRRREWENDMIAVLHHHNLLEQVLGRQPDAAVFAPWTEASVDEFGRNVQSQFTMQLEQRRKRRHMIEQQRSEKIRGDESDAFLTDNEKEAFRERHRALQEALELSLSGLEEEYTSLQNLVDVFEEWKNHDEEEYQQCHAALSLADLVTPLIQAELCALNDPWDESGGYNESKWLSVIYRALELKVIDDAGIERIVEKAVIPSFGDLLEKSGYELLSYRQTKSITGFWHHLSKIVPSSDTPAISNLRRRLLSYIQERLMDISMPIVKKDAINLADEDIDDDVLQSAIKDATVGQMHRIKKALLNVLSFWAPILGKENEFVETVLGFVSGKFLFLLSSIQGFPQPRFEGTPNDVFQQIYKELESTGWLEEDNLMLHTMPIRAAATMYKRMEVSVG